MAQQFERISKSGNVLLKKGTDILHMLESNCYVVKDGRNPNKIIISNEGGPSGENQRVEVLATNIDFPVHTGVDDLIRQLSSDFFIGPAGSNVYGDNASKAVVTASLTSVLLIAANTDRKKVLIVNKANRPLETSLGVAAVSDEGVPFDKDDFMEEVNYRGDIFGIWTGGGLSGTAVIYEVTT